MYEELYLANTILLVLLQKNTRKHRIFPCSLGIWNDVIIRLHAVLNWKWAWITSSYNTF